MTLRVLQNIGSWVKINYSILITALISLSIRSTLPGDGGGNSPADDLLAVRQANSILEGDWLGPWNYVTNSKPPGMAFYLVGVHFIPIEYKYVTHVFYLLATYILAVQMMRYLEISRHPRFGKFLIFAIFALNPIVFQEQFNRVYRNTIVVIVMFLFFAIFLRLLIRLRTHNALIQSKQFKSGNPAKAARSGDWKIPTVIGIVFLALKLLREDSYWLLPVTFLFFCFEIIRMHSGLQLKMRIFATSIIFSILGYAVPSLPAQSANFTYYGDSSLEDFYTGNFAEAIKLWQSVEPGSDPRPYVPVNRAQRLAVYEVSETAKRLSPYLELGPNVGWKMNSCGSPVKVCDESAAWFPWELRDAAVVSGGVRNSAEFQALFKQIASDIESACEGGVLSCGDSGLGPGTKALGTKDLKPLMQYFKMNLSYIFNTATGGRIAAPDRSASNEINEEWHQVVNYKSAPLSVPMNTMQKSKNLELYEKGWSYVFWLFLIIVVLSLVRITWTRLELNYLKLLIYFSGCGLVNAVGLSVFNYSIGFYVGGTYILGLQFCFILTAIVSILYFIDKINISRLQIKSEKKF